MAGHSKWANIKHKKAKEDAKKGKVFTKLIREITVVARDGGGDPANNPRLRLLLDKARAANMPADNVTRAIKKGTGELEGAHYEAAMYEGYGPNGVAIIIEALTDNKNRTVADVRHTFSKHGCSLGDSGTVGWMFEHLAVVTLIKPETVSEDDLLEQFIDHDVDDVSVGDETIRLTGSREQLMQIKQAAEELGYAVDSAQLEWVPTNKVELDDVGAEKVLNFLDALDDLDDIQNVYADIAGQRIKNGCKYEWV